MLTKQPQQILELPQLSLLMSIEEAKRIADAVLVFIKRNYPDELLDRLSSLGLKTTKAGEIKEAYPDLYIPFLYFCYWYKVNDFVLTNGKNAGPSGFPTNPNTLATVIHNESLKLKSATFITIENKSKFEV